MLLALIGTGYVRSERGNEPPGDAVSPPPSKARVAGSWRWSLHCTAVGSTSAPHPDYERAGKALAAVAPTKDKGQQSGAVGFLLDILAHAPVPVKTIEERAAVRGFSKDQQKRAKQKMGVVAFKEGMVDGRWFWALPQHAPQEAA
jgi:hypothetical protein